MSEWEFGERGKRNVGTEGAAGGSGDGPESGAPTGTGRDEDAGEQPTGERISEGFRQGLGVLSAFRDALEETIREARERGELSSDRARQMVREAMGRAREAAGEARERLDFAQREEVERLREQVDELRVRLENLEQRTPQASDVGPGRPAGEDPGAGGG